MLASKIICKAPMTAPGGGVNFYVATMRAYERAALFGFKLLRRSGIRLSICLLMQDPILGVLARNCPFKRCCYAIFI